MKKCRNKSGFTLVELIVIITIIGILLALSIVSYLGYVEKARASMCSTNIYDLKNILTSNMLLNDSDNLETEYGKLSTDEKSKYACPSGGTIMVQGDDIWCTKHSGNEVTEMENIIAKASDAYASLKGYKSDLSMIEQYYEDNGNTLVAFNKQANSGTWEKIFGDYRLYKQGDSAQLYWRPKTVSVNGSTKYILSANYGNEVSTAAWKGFACYYGGKYYVSTATVSWDGNSLDELTINVPSQASDEAVENWLVSKGWKAVS